MESNKTLAGRERIVDLTSGDVGGPPSVSTRGVFGGLVRRYRRRLGLSQERLAERAEVSPRELSYLETGKHRPYPGTARRLALALELEGEERALFLRTAEPEEMPNTPLGLARLPAELTSFVGRRQEVEAVLNFLGSPDVRLVTLMGPGGIGKTRLALRAGNELTGRFADGVVFVSLAPVRSPELVSGAIMATLALRDTGGRPAIDVLTEYLRDREILLILDNFEHLLEGGHVVADLLSACPRLSMLVTSRTLLHLTAEQVLDVPPLAMPDPDTLPTLDALSQFDAVTLFVARARARKADFVLTAESAPVVAAICRQLDGVPLAIELAAARVPFFSPQALLARLSRRLPLLTGGPRDLPERQQTLRGTIDWSYRLLTVEEQRLFARLSVFHGGCSLDAVESICAMDDGEFDVLEGMTSLMDKSLLRQVESREGEPRFAMLETIREYAWERLIGAGEEDTARLRHAEYFAQLAAQLVTERATRWLYVPQLTRYPALLDEHESNLWAALVWAIERGEAVLGLQLAPALWTGFYYSSQLMELNAYLESLLAMDAVVPPAVRAQALIVAGITASDPERAQRLLDGAIVLCRQIGDRFALLRALLTSASGPIATNPKEREAQNQEALMLARELGARNAIGMSLRGLGFAAQSRGNLVEARAFFEESLAVERANGYPLGIAWSGHALAFLELQDGHGARAQELAATCEPIYRAADAFWDLANLQHLRGIALFLQEDHAGLYACFHRSAPEPQIFSIDRFVAQWLYLLAAARAADGAAENAACLLGAANACGYRVEDTGMAPFQAMVAERLAAGRSKVDQATWDAAWREGRAMTVREAWSYALSSVPRAGAPLS